MFPFTLLLHLHRLWTTSWWKQTRMQTDSSTGLSSCCPCSELAWNRLAPRGRTRRCHGKKAWLISLVFNELLQCRTGVRAAKPSLPYSLQDTQVHCVEGQGWDPHLMADLQPKDCFFQSGSCLGSQTRLTYCLSCVGWGRGRGHHCSGCCSISWRVSLWGLVLHCCCSGAKEGKAVRRSFSWSGAANCAPRSSMSLFGIWSESHVWLSHKDLWLYLQNPRLGQPNHASSSTALHEYNYGFQTRASSHLAGWEQVRRVSICIQMGIPVL